MNCWEEGSKKHLSEEVEYYDAMCFEWTLGGHKKLLSTDLTYLTAGKQRFFRWQTPLFTLFTIVSLCLSKFTLNQKMHVYHLGLFHCTECTSLFQLLASRKPLLNMAQGIKFKGRPVGQLKYLTMTMAFSKKSHLILDSLLEVSIENLS